LVLFINELVMDENVRTFYFDVHMNVL